MRTTVLSVLALALVALVAFCAYAFITTGTIPYIGTYLGMSNDTSRTAFTEKLSEAMSAHSNQDFDASIAQFEALLAEAQGKAETSAVQNKLAINLINRGFRTSEYNEDVRRGMDMLWTVALDQENPANIRANAFGDLGTIASFHGNTFYTTYYTPAPFNTLVGSSTDPYKHYEAALNIFKYADDLFPTTYTKYSIAKMYTHLLSNGVFSAGSEASKEAARSIQQYITEGDALYAQNPNAFAHGSTARMLLDRAQGLTLSAMTLRNKTASEQEAAFKEAFDAIRGFDQSSKYVTDVLMETRFWYAAVMYANFGTPRVAEVQEVLAPFKPGATPAENYVVTRTTFVNWGAAQPYTNLGQRLAVSLSRVAPDFKEFLVSIGWKL